MFVEFDAGRGHVDGSVEEVFRGRCCGGGDAIEAEVVDKACNSYNLPWRNVQHLRVSV